MKRYLQIIVIGAFAVASLCAQGSSVETATAISLGGSASATMNDSSPNHYWKITTTTNGYLRIEVNSASTIDVDVSLRDVNGTSTLHSDGRYGTYSEVFAFVKPGTYFVYCTRWSGTTGSYTISNTFAAPPRAGDPEPNDTYSEASQLIVGATATGHLGFTGGGATDTQDFWKLTTTQNGWLRVQVRSDSLDLRGDGGLDFDVSLRDVNGTSTISSDGRTGTFSQVSAFLRPGTYYVNVYRWTGRAGSYEIKAEIFPPPLGNDVEGNDTYGTATTATLNGSVTGHIGYYSNGTTDTQDFWKFTTTANGTVTVRVVSDSVDRSGAVLDLDIALLDVNGSSTIASDGRAGPLSQCVAHLQPGTFFVRVYRWTGNAGSYSLNITHTPPRLANDVEGNDAYTDATPLTFGIQSSGHIGYFINGFTDTQDFWRVVAPSSDSLYIHVVSDSTLDLDLALIAPNGTSVVSSDGRTGIYSRVGTKPTAGTTYYARVYRWSGSAGSYSILATHSFAVSVERDASAASTPAEFTLDQNYPNPFNPSTTIRYGIPKAGRVRVSVYSILGQEVALLYDGIQMPAVYTARWDGRSSSGQELASGVYLFRVELEGKSLVRKALLLR